MHNQYSTPQQILEKLSRWINRDFYYMGVFYKVKPLNGSEEGKSMYK